MTRFRFSTVGSYAAKLNDVINRPIENSPSGGVSLLRLNFEIFEMLHGNVLRSYRRFACREFVVGRAVQACNDAKLLDYAQALSLPTTGIDSLEDWGKLLERRPWISIQFGEPSPIDHRQPFVKIGSFSPLEYKIEQVGFELSNPWGSINDAAAYLSLSLSTVRRRVDELSLKYGRQLVVLTEGGHRRIYLPLLKQLLDE